MAAKDGIEHKVSYRDNKGHLEPFSSPTASRIVAALATRKKRLSYVTANNVSITVDLKRMKRVNTDSEKESDIIVEITSQHAIKRIEATLGRRQLLSSLAEDLCSPNFFRSIMNKNASPCYKIECVETNEHAAKGGKLFSRFLDALEKKSNEIPGLLDEIVDLALKRREIGEESTIQFLFHGTPRRNLTSMCEKGMDPRLRRKEGDYFGVYARTSIPYCNKEDFLFSGNCEWPDGCRLLVFLVLLPGP